MIYDFSTIGSVCVEIGDVNIFPINDVGWLYAYTKHEITTLAVMTTPVITTLLTIY